MDPLTFGLKRAHWSMLRVSRRDFNALGLTQARMDILHALRRAHSNKRPMWQSNLRRILGYTARSTLTQLLKALEGLGLIRRRRSRRDARQLEVELTARGQETRERTYDHFVNKAWVYTAPEYAMRWSPRPDEEVAWQAYVDRTSALHKTLGLLRFALRDTATLRYAWPARE